MKFIVSSQALKVRLAPLFKCVNFSTVLPILEDVLFVVDMEKKQLYVEATDLENTISTTLDIEAGASGNVCLPAKMLRSVVNCQEQPLTFSVDKNFVVTIIGCEMKIKIQGENPDSFPKRVVFEDAKAHATYDTKLIVPLLAAASTFASNDDSRPSMTGVFMHKRKNDDKNLWIIATDAHRLYYEPLPLPETMKECSMIIPKKAIALLREIKKTEHVKIEQNNSHCRFTTGSYTIISRHIDARYPDYEVVIPKTEYSFKLVRKEAIAFIKIAQDFANKSTNQMILLVDPKNARIELTTQDIDFSMEFSCNLRAYDFKMEEPLTIAFNARFILHNLAQNKDEYVFIEHAGLSTKAIIMDNHILTMPLMLNQ